MVKKAKDKLFLLEVADSGLSKDEINNIINNSEVSE